jgi:hypothetical protein
MHASNRVVTSALQSGYVIHNHRCVVDKPSQTVSQTVKTYPPRSDGSGLEREPTATHDFHHSLAALELLLIQHDAAGFFHIFIVCPRGVLHVFD